MTRSKKMSKQLEQQVPNRKDWPWSYLKNLGYHQMCSQVCIISVSIWQLWRDLLTRSRRWQGCSVDSWIIRMRIWGETINMESLHVKNYHNNNTNNDSTTRMLGTATVITCIHVKTIHYFTKWKWFLVRKIAQKQILILFHTEWPKRQQYKMSFIMANKWLINNT